MLALQAVARSARQPESGYRRGWVGWLALFAILFQIAVPVFHNPAQAQGSGQPAFLICTAQGLVALPAADSGPAKDRPASPAIPCPICLALHLAVSFPPPTAPALPAVAMVETAVAAPLTAPLAAATRPATAHRPRGPPTIA